MSGFAFALVDMSAQTTAERAEAADILVRESDRLRQLLDDVRHLHRLELAESVRQEQVEIGALCTQTAQRFRVDKARDRATGGSGLGLAIARRAAQALGARIEVESKPGEGSEFRLLLPSGPQPPTTNG